MIYISVKITVQRARNQIPGIHYTWFYRTVKKSHYAVITVNDIVHYKDGVVLSADCSAPAHLSINANSYRIYVELSGLCYLTFWCKCRL